MTLIEYAKEWLSKINGYTCSSEEAEACSIITDFLNENTKYRQALEGIVREYNKQIPAIDAIIEIGKIARAALGGVE